MEGEAKIFDHTVYSCVLMWTVYCMLHGIYEAEYDIELKYGRVLSHIIQNYPCQKYILRLPLFQIENDI